jgi:hypothetical protein
MIPLKRFGARSLKNRDIAGNLGAAKFAGFAGEAFRPKGFSAPLAGSARDEFFPHAKSQEHFN